VNAKVHESERRRTPKVLDFGKFENRLAFGLIQPKPIPGGGPVVPLRAGDDTEGATTIAEHLREGLP
jgi:hypothetical protein